MKLNVVLMMAWLVSAPLAHAEKEAMPSSGMMHGGHDHSGMPGMDGMMHKPVPWTAFPLLKTRMSGESRDTMVTTVVPQNIVANSIDAYSNNLKDDTGRRQLPLDMAGAKLDKPASGGFHWLSASEEQGGRVLVASTVYSFGERGAKDPTAMFMLQKHNLEIIPQPYPREHSRYRADENWKDRKSVV